MEEEMEEAMEEVMEEDTEEAHMEEEEGTSLKEQLLAILDTRLKEDTKPPRIRETTLRRPNKPIQQPLQDLLHMGAACSATVVGPRRLFSSASTTLASGENCAAASTM